MRATPILALVVAVAASALGSATASAATIVVRPNATTLFQVPWTAAPGGQSADVALADGVMQPAAPGTTSDLLTAGTGNGGYATVAFPAPSLPAGAAPTKVTAWVYARVGSSQTLTATVWGGIWVLGWTSWSASPAGWHSITLAPTPSAALLGQLSLALRTDGSAGVTPTKVYAAYLQVDVPDVAAAGGAPDGGAKAVDQPAATGTKPDGTANAPVLATPSGPAGPIVILPATVELTVAATTVPVDVSCPAAAGAGCSGRVRIELAPSPAVEQTKKARAARCARGCRVIGDSAFTVAAGKQRPVPVKLRPAAYKLLPRGKQVKARVTVTSRDRRGRVSATTRAISIHRARH